ncbi:Morn2 [Symbiodinium sp. KB8]|nr:Morn2 [Symbiodinium sp. KB8]
MAASDGTQEAAASAGPVVGTGTFQLSSGTYTGEYLEVEGVKTRHGKGRYEDANGQEVYEGEWKGDAMHGSGVFRAAGGAVYEGDFQENMFHGKGTYRWSSGATYSGQWQFNRMHGEGSWTSAEGVRFMGEFFAGKMYNGKAYVSLQ